MKLPIRLENAITKLYTAFHEGTLNACDSCACAVGNMCDNNGDWRLHARFDTHQKNEVISNNYKLPKCIINTGYTANELVNVERLFLESCKFGKGTKQQQFKGLCAVAEYLCELDNIPNVMDYTKLFETENEKPKYQLTNQLN